MGMMLETMSERLWAEPGQPHFGSPDKEPAVRLRVLEDAGRSSIPFTTGILVGIGETPAERVEALLAIRASARRHGHVQEVIVQNFRAKERTPMRGVPDLGLEDYVATVAVARLLLGPRMRVQVPPNLSDPTELGLLLRAGVDDWGGVSPLTPDHVNPERPWPHLDDLTRLTADGRVQPRRAAHRPPGVRAGAGALARPAGAAARRGPRRPDHRSRRSRAAARPVCPWQEPDPDWGTRRRRQGRPARRDRHRRAHRGPARSDFDAVYGDWDGDRRAGARRGPAAARTPGGRATRPWRAALRRALDDPAGLTDDEYLALMTATGVDLDAVCALADDVRRVGGR